MMEDLRVGRAEKSWCGEVNQRQQLVVPTTASVVYCGQFIIFSSRMKINVSYL